MKPSTIVFRLIYRNDEQVIVYRRLTVLDFSVELRDPGLEQNEELVQYLDGPTKYVVMNGPFLSRQVLPEKKSLLWTHPISVSASMDNFLKPSRRRMAFSFCYALRQRATISLSP